MRLQYLDRFTVLPLPLRGEGGIDRLEEFARHVVGRIQKFSRRYRSAAYNQQRSYPSFHVEPRDQYV